MLKNYNTAAAFGLPSSLSFLARPSSDDRFIDMPCNLRFAAFRLYLAETGLGARQFCYREEGETPRVFPGGMLFRKVPGAPCLGALEKTTTACARAGQADPLAVPVQPVQPQSADAPAAGTASPVGHPKPGRVPSVVGGIWREVTSCSLAGCMAVTNDNGFGLRCIP